MLNDDQSIWNRGQQPLPPHLARHVWKVTNFPNDGEVSYVLPKAIWQWLRIQALDEMRQRQRREQAAKGEP